MNGSACPKCGSNKILNDECLNCGIIVSKFQKSEKAGASPLSFVAPTLPSTPGRVGPSAIADNEYKIALQRNKTYTSVFIGIAFLALAVGGYFAFKHFRKSTSSYGGLYKNDRQIFVLRFPDYGWNHYYSDELDSLMLKNSQDAFYRGKNRENPDIFLGMWIHLMPRIISPTLSDEQRQGLFDAAAEKILTLMEEAGMECNITDPQFRGNGAVMDAEVLKGEQRFNAKMRTGYWMNRAYLLIVLGNESAMDSAEEEITRIINSLGFQMSVV